MIEKHSNINFAISSTTEIETELPNCLYFCPYAIPSGKLNLSMPFSTNAYPAKPCSCAHSGGFITRIPSVLSIEALPFSSFLHTLALVDISNYALFQNF